MRLSCNKWPALALLYTVLNPSPHSSYETAFHLPTICVKFPFWVLHPGRLEQFEYDHFFPAIKLFAVSCSEQIDYANHEATLNSFVWSYNRSGLDLILQPYDPYLTMAFDEASTCSF